MEGSRYRFSCDAVRSSAMSKCSFTCRPVTLATLLPTACEALCYHVLPVQDGEQPTGKIPCANTIFTLAEQGREEGKEGVGGGRTRIFSYLFHTFSFPFSGLPIHLFFTLFSPFFHLFVKKR